jgi:large subunit ribosomal protein L31e
MSKEEQKLERVYTVPLSRAWITARHKRTKRAVKVLREFAEHHMKSEEIKIDTELNERLWNRGITKPPRRITVKMEKDEDGVVTISLPKVEKTAIEKEEKTAETTSSKSEEETPQGKKNEPSAKETPAKKAPKKAPAKRKKTKE